MNKELQEYYNFLDQVCSYSLSVMSRAVKEDKIILNGIDPSNKAHLALVNISYILCDLYTKPLMIYVKTGLWNFLKLRWKYTRIHYMKRENEIPTIEELMNELEKKVQEDLNKNFHAQPWLEKVYEEYYKR